MGNSLRKPLALQRGDLTVVKKQELKQQEESVKTDHDEIMTPPAWLENAVAIEEWNRVVPQLLEIDVVGNLDRTSIGGYCNAYARWIKASKELEKMPLAYVDKATGRTKANPYIDIQIKYAQEMRKFAEQCGLTISSRLKAAATKTKQQENNIEQVFGVI